ncbi:MAG: hypothetical protein ACRDJH_15250 [Thermomicrobiales bacterium]
MPDRDIFRTHVKREWRSSACKAFALNLSDNTIAAIIHNSATQLKNTGGCPGLDIVIGIAARATGVEVPRLSVEEAVRQLDAVCRKMGKETTYLAVREAKSFLLDPALDPASFAASSYPQLSQAVSESFLVAYVASGIFPACLTAELVESGHWTMDQIRRRRKDLYQQLREDSDFVDIARRLLDDPSGAQIRTGRRKTNRRSVEELVFMPLTVD